MKKELISRGQTDIYAHIQCKTKAFIHYLIKKFENFDFNENLCICIQHGSYFNRILYYKVKLTFKISAFFHILDKNF